MPKDKTENHKKIIVAAQKEFIAHGFKNASLRRIASEAGMSVSGLYKHFSSKEEMFAALVEPAYDGLVKIYRQFADETCRMLDNKADFSDIWEYSHETAWIMGYIYENFEAFYLAVCKAEGTRYESFLHDIAKMGEDRTLQFMRQLSSLGVKLNTFSRKEFHLLTTTYMDAIFEAVRHNFTKSEALHYAETLDKFFTLSWKSFFGY